MARQVACELAQGPAWAQDAVTNYEYLYLRGQWRAGMHEVR